MTGLGQALMTAGKTFRDVKTQDEEDKRRAEQQALQAALMNEQIGTAKTNHLQDIEKFGTDEAKALASSLPDQTLISNDIFNKFKGTGGETFFSPDATLRSKKLDLTGMLGEPVKMNEDPSQLTGAGFRTNMPTDAKAALQSNDLSNKVSRAQLAAYMAQTNAQANRDNSKDIAKGHDETTLAAAGIRADSQPGVAAAKSLPEIPDDVIGPDVLKLLDPKTRSTIDMLTSYKGVMPSAYLMAKSPYWQGILEIAHRVDPSFDVQAYPARQALIKDFTSGKSAVGLRSLNALTGHLSQLKNEAEGLQNTGVPAWNYLSNAASKATVGNPKLKAFNSTATAVQSELARFLKGTGATDQEINHWREQFNASQTPEEFGSFFSSLADLVDKQANAYKDIWTAGMGKQDGFDPYTPEGQKAVDALRSISKLTPAVPVGPVDSMATPASVPPDVAAPLSGGYAAYLASKQKAK